VVATPGVVVAVVAEVAAKEDAPRPEAAVAGAVVRPGVAEVVAGAEAMVAQDAPRPEVAAAVGVARLGVAAVAAGMASSQTTAEPDARPEAAVVRPDAVEAATASAPSAAREWSSPHPARDRDEAKVAPLPRILPCRSAAASWVEAEPAAVAPAAPRRPVSCGASYCSG
jgi:hypothetical protein